jgi:hypothetical protein
MIVGRTQNLESLYELALREAKQRLRLHADEARCILDACNGQLSDPLGQRLRVEVQDAIRVNGLDRKWNVDGRSLASRLRGMPRALTAAVQIWIADFWWSGRVNDAGWVREHIALLVDDVDAVDALESAQPLRLRAPPPPLRRRRRPLRAEPRGVTKR